MNSKNKTKKDGISLRKLNYILFFVTLFLLICLAASILLTFTRFSGVRTDTDNYIEWQTAAEKLQIGSDYLTEQVRSFSVTGDRQYLDNYFEESTVTRQRDSSIEAIRQNLSGTDAYDYLASAMEISMKLMEREYYSMRLTVEAYKLNIAELPFEIRSVELSDEDLALSADEQAKKAQDMLFDEEYHGAKELISGNIARCVASIATITRDNMSDSFDKLRVRLILQNALVLMLGAAVVVIVVCTSIFVFKPLIRAVPNIKAEKKISEKGAYEYSYLAKTYNSMFETNKDQKKQLAYEATHDILTNVFNRAGFEKYCDDFSLKNTAMIIIDIDNFKKINDTYGHGTGDRSLVTVAGEIKRNFRTNDIICRIGGDEFVVIMINVRDNDEFRSIIKHKFTRINESIGNPENDLPPFAISAGIVFSDEQCTDSDELFNRADAALYHIKNSGKRSCAFYDEIPPEEA